MQIRPLDPDTDLAAVLALTHAAHDFWLLSDGHLDAPQKAAAFFTDTPPSCDPGQSHRFGLFLQGQLIGLAELSFGFPNVQDAYLGLLLLAPQARGKGHGPALLAYAETLARKAHAPQLFVAVLEANPRARAFWQRHGFHPTGLSGRDPDTGHTLHRLVKPL